MKKLLLSSICICGFLLSNAVSSQELQRVPLSLMSGANDVVPVCTRISSLEKRMEKMKDEVSMFTMG